MSVFDEDQPLNRLMHVKKVNLDSELQNKDYLKINELPHNVVIAKLLNEVGINISSVDIINPIENGIESVLPDTTSSQHAKAPVFTNILHVNEGAKCYQKYGHKVHYDLTYIAKYSKIDGTISGDVYDSIEIEYDLSRFNFGANSLENDLTQIRTRLTQRINEYLKDSRNITMRVEESELYLSSIPLMIYQAMRLCKNMNK